MTRTAYPVRSGVSVADFDPNTSMGSLKFWMVYDGNLKLRRTRGPAITDFNHASRAKLYEWDPALNAWRLLADKSLPHQPVCDLCGSPTVGYPRRYDYSRNEYVDDTTMPKRDLGAYVFLRRNGKLIDPLQLVYACRECRDGRGL